MSKTIAIRVSDDIYSALEAQCQATEKTMTQLLTPIILGMIELPAAPLSPIEQRLAVIEDRVLAITELETQMSEVVDRLDAIDRDKTHPIAPQLDTGLEPVAIDRKRSPKSIRDLDKGGTSTSEFKLAPDDILTDLINQGHRAEAIAQELNKRDYTNTKGKPLTRGSVNKRIKANSKLNLLYTQNKTTH